MKLQKRTSKIKLYYQFWFIFFSGLLSYLYANQITFVPQNRVMSLAEFKQAINNNDFLKQEGMTLDDYPFDPHELEGIENAIKYENMRLGGQFDHKREINKFSGMTLVVGGGKRPGKYHQNNGKTVLIDTQIHEQEIKTLIQNLRSGKWGSDPYTGKTFNTKSEKNIYIKKLIHKLSLYKKAFKEKNEDILNRYYTINIEKDLQSDMLASITNEADMRKIPDNKFMYVEFEHIPCHVFLDPRLYPILERITKPNGKITLSISYDCHRLIVPVIQSTKFGKEFIRKLKAGMYTNLQNMNARYGAHNITIINHKENCYN